MACRVADNAKFWDLLVQQGWVVDPAEAGANSLFASLELLIPDRLEPVLYGRRIRDWLADELAVDFRRSAAPNGAPGVRWAHLLGDPATVADPEQQREWLRQLRSDDDVDGALLEPLLWMLAELTGPLVVFRPGRSHRLFGDIGQGPPRFLIEVAGDYIPAWPPATGPAQPEWAITPHLRPASTADEPELAVTDQQVAWLTLFDRQILPQPTIPNVPDHLFGALLDLAPQRVAELLGYQVGVDVEGRPAEIQALRTRVARHLADDIGLGPESQYRSFELARDWLAVIEAVDEASEWDPNTAALAAMVAADLMQQPIIVLGPDDAGSAHYGQSYRDNQLELVLLPGGDYLALQNLAQDSSEPPPRVSPLFSYEELMSGWSTHVGTSSVARYLGQQLSAAARRRGLHDMNEHRITITVTAASAAAWDVLGILQQTAQELLQRIDVHIDGMDGGDGRVVRIVPDSDPSSIVSHPGPPAPAAAGPASTWDAQVTSAEETESEETESEGAGFEETASEGSEDEGSGGSEDEDSSVGEGGAEDEDSSVGEGGAEDEDSSVGEGGAEDEDSSEGVGGAEDEESPSDAQEVAASAGSPRRLPSWLPRPQRGGSAGADTSADAATSTDTAGPPRAGQPSIATLRETARGPLLRFWGRLRGGDTAGGLDVPLMPSIWPWLPDGDPDSGFASFPSVDAVTYAIAPVGSPPARAVREWLVRLRRSGRSTVVVTATRPQTLPPGGMLVMFAPGQARNVAKRWGIDVGMTMEVSVEEALYATAFDRSSETMTVVAVGTFDPGRQPVAGRAGDGMVAQNRWEIESEVWSEILDRLAKGVAPNLDKMPEGFPGDLYAGVGRSCPGST